MRALVMCASFMMAFLVVGGLIGQEPKTGNIKGDPKTIKGDTKGDPKVEPKVDPKFKGQLPQNWKQLGLTDEQTQKVYKIQAKHNEEIDKLENQIKELKAKMVKERGEVLTAEQKKRLEDILKSKSGTDK